MEVTNQEVAAVLRKARARVKKGWCKGAYLNAKNEVCAVGAILTVNDPTLERLGSRTEVNEAAKEAVRSVIDYTIFPWNDHPETTKADVLAAFDAALVLVEG